MAYGKIYIADLSKKVTDLFNELIDAKKLNEKEFISSFKEKYPSLNSIGRTTDKSTLSNQFVTPATLSSSLSSKI